MNWLGGICIDTGVDVLVVKYRIEHFLDRLNFDLSKGSGERWQIELGLSNIIMILSQVNESVLTIRIPTTNALIV